MSSHREIGGVAVAFAGFAFLVLAFKGTWHDVYLAAIGKGSDTSSNQPPSKKSSASAASGFPGGNPPANPLKGRK